MKYDICDLLDISLVDLSRLTWNTRGNGNRGWWHTTLIRGLYIAYRAPITLADVGGTIADDDHYNSLSRNVHIVL